MCYRTGRCVQGETRKGGWGLMFRVLSCFCFVPPPQRRLSHLRLFRDYSICDLVFEFTSVTMLALASMQPAVRAFLCEELSRQPDLLRSLSDNAGLNIENCERWLERGVLASVAFMVVVIVVRVSRLLHHKFRLIA